MAMCMKNRIIEYLKTIDPITQHHRPFAITFDKVTLLKRSMQVIIIIVLIDGQLTPLYLQSSLCKTELGGEELAANCVNVLALFGLTKSMLQQQLTACAVDGAYIHLNINKHLCQNIGIRENWLTVSWDVAHLLELAINDVQNQKKFNWLQTFIKICAGLMTKYSHGKQYELLKQAAELIEEKIVQPKQFHATRFVSSELRVFEAVLRNWTSFYYLQEKDDITKELTGGNISTRTRQQFDVQQQSGDKDIDKVKVN
jgi:hypothetical protein